MGALTFYTTQSCRPGTIAYYKKGSEGSVVLCPEFFYNNADVAQRCFQQDQPSSVIHEMTHVPFIMGTEDYSDYTMRGVQMLPAVSNLGDANTYQFFAQCKPKELLSHKIV